MAAPAAQAWRKSDKGLILALRVTPNAGRDAIEGVELRDDGSAVLRVRVKAVPDKGKANAAVIALLAHALHVPKSGIAIIAGDTARLKTAEITGSAEALAAALAELG